MTTQELKMVEQLKHRITQLESENEELRAQLKGFGGLIQSTNQVFIQSMQPPPEKDENKQRE